MFYLTLGVRPGLNCIGVLATRTATVPGHGIENSDNPADFGNAVEEETEGEEELPIVERLYDLEPEDDITTDPLKATEDGYPYTPPTDPPIVPSEDLEGAEVAAGFASSMEGSHPDEEILPLRVETGDLELEQHVYTVLRNNSETQNLTDIKVSVCHGVVFVRGTVQSDNDIAIVDDIVNDLDGVVGVRNYLRLRE